MSGPVYMYQRGLYLKQVPIVLLEKGIKRLSTGWYVCFFFYTCVYFFTIDNVMGLAGAPRFR